jgi:hypothetical protein
MIGSGFDPVRPRNTSIVGIGLWLSTAVVGAVQTGGVKVALLTLLTAQFFDFGTFVTMVGRYGPAAEANPIVNALLVAHGIPLLFAAKLALVAFVAAVVAILAEDSKRPSLRVAAGVLAIGIVAGLIGGASNARTLIPI